MLTLLLPPLPILGSLNYKRFGCNYSTSDMIHNSPAVVSTEHIECRIDVTRTSCSKFKNAIACLLIIELLY